MPETDHEGVGVTFPLPDPHLAKVAWFGLVAASSAWLVWPLLTGSETFAGWPGAGKAFAALCLAALAYRCGSRARGEWLAYRRRHDAPRIEQLDNPQ